MSLDNVKQVLLVLSGKGGVGKSSVTTQLALALTLRGHNVGILDIDLTGPSIPRFLNIEDAKIIQAPGGWLPVEVHRAQTLPPVPRSPQAYHQNGVPLSDHHATASSSDHPAKASSLDPPQHNGTSEETASSAFQAPSTTSPPPQTGSLHAMSLGLLLASRDSSIVWRGPKKTAMVRQFLSDVLWPPLDYLLIDTPPGTSDEHISLAESLLKLVTEAAAASKPNPRLAGAVIVTTPQAVALSDVRKELNFCAKTGLGVVGVVENMSGYVCPCCGEATNIFSKGGGRAMAEEVGVPFLGEAPLDGLWGELVEEGIRPVYTAVAVPDTEDEGSGGEGGGVEGSGVEGGGLEAKGLEDSRVERRETQTQTDTQTKRRDPALLVDKYRSCSLCPVFERIAGQVHGTVSRGAAVRLSNG